jgi:hypothetical protein
MLLWAIAALASSETVDLFESFSLTWLQAIENESANAVIITLLIFNGVYF